MHYDQSTIYRPRAPRIDAGERKRPATAPSTRPLIVLTGRDAAGAVVASDSTDSPARAASIAKLWRECGLVVETIGEN